MVFAPFTVKVLINKNNIGYAQNFSQALTYCDGDIVFMSDQDDVWHATKIEKMLTQFIGNPKLQLLIHDLEYCKENLTPIGQTKIDRMESAFNVERDYVVGMASAIRGPFLKLCLPIPNQVDVAHDGWLHECAWAVDRKAVMREVLALYRRHPSNATALKSLNVDFVTTPSDFKGGGKSSLALLKTKTTLSVSSHPSLAQWLQSNRGTLVDQRYATAAQIEGAIEKLLYKTETTNRRIRILQLARWKRLLPVIHLYRVGGYYQFSGWKSALKDLLLN